MHRCKIDLEKEDLIMAAHDIDQVLPKTQRYFQKMLRIRLSVGFAKPKYSLNSELWSLFVCL